MASLSYDLVLKGGRVVDPAAGHDKLLDVAVSDGRIAAVVPEIPAGQARETIDVSGHLVLPGLIDSHAHVFEHAVGRFGLNPDDVGVRAGVTSVIDLGGPSHMSVAAFRRYVVERADTRIFSFISIYAGGEGHLSPDMYGAGIDVKLCIKAIEANRDLIKGIKVDAEIASLSLYGLDVVEKAKEASRGAGVPLYMHLGQLFPVPDETRYDLDADALVPAAAAALEAGDILAHPFTRYPGGFVDSRTGQVHSAIKEALDRGVRIDIGHGSHFSFDMARKVLDAGIVPMTLGGDLHGYNTAKPLERGTPADHPDEEMSTFGSNARFSLVHAMTELLALGLDLPTVVAMTTSNCAETLGDKSGLGTLTPGAAADISVLADLRGRWTLKDNDGVEVPTERILKPLFCMKSGKRFDADSPILPQDLAA